MFNIDDDYDDNIFDKTLCSVKIFFQNRYI